MSKVKVDKNKYFKAVLNESVNITVTDVIVPMLENVDSIEELKDQLGQLITNMVDKYEEFKNSHPGAAEKLEGVEDKAKEFKNFIDSVLNDSGNKEVSGATTDVAAETVPAQSPAQPTPKMESASLSKENFFNELTTHILTEAKKNVVEKIKKAKDKDKKDEVKGYAVEFKGPKGEKKKVVKAKINPKNLSKLAKLIKAHGSKKEDKK